MLELIYNSTEEIPSGFESLYTEKDGKWHLTGIKGMKTSDDVTKLQTSLRKERDDHKKTKDRLATVEAQRIVEKLWREAMSE